jgi:hypothetical protein
MAQGVLCLVVCRGGDYMACIFLSVDLLFPLLRLPREASGEERLNPLPFGERQSEGLQLHPARDGLAEGADQLDDSFGNLKKSDLLRNAHPCEVSVWGERLNFYLKSLCTSFYSISRVKVSGFEITPAFD